MKLRQECKHAAHAAAGMKCTHVCTHTYTHTHIYNAPTHALAIAPDQHAKLSHACSSSSSDSNRNNSKSDSGSGFHFLKFVEGEGGHTQAQGCKSPF